MAFFRCPYEDPNEKDFMRLPPDHYDENDDFDQYAVEIHLTMIVTARNTNEAAGIAADRMSEVPDAADWSVENAELA